MDIQVPLFCESTVAVSVRAKVDLSLRQILPAMRKVNMPTQLPCRRADYGAMRASWWMFCPNMGLKVGVGRVRDNFGAIVIRLGAFNAEKSSTTMYTTLMCLEPTRSVKAFGTLFARSSIRLCTLEGLLSKMNCNNVPLKRGVFPERFIARRVFSAAMFFSAFMDGCVSSESSGGHESFPTSLPITYVVSKFCMSALDMVFQM